MLTRRTVIRGNGNMGQDSETAAYLGVEKSLTGRRWVGLDASTDRAARALAQQADLHPVVAAILAARGVDSVDVQGFLQPTLRELMPDPNTLKDMEKAAQRLVEAVTRKERVAIFADYDVDGAASAALLIDWLRALGRDPSLYIPHRIEEGYGPNVPAMEQLARNHDLIVCVDCGSLSHDPIAAANAAGAQVLVLDHHLGPETLPPAHALVNPNRQDEETALTYLCAAGVVFLLLVAANRLMRNDKIEPPDLIPALDIVALATVADVAPLQGLNRGFVRQGLKIMAERRRSGLRALADVAGLSTAPTSYHLGFVLGPRLNAAGRIGEPDLGARLLTTQSEVEARELAQRLDQLNRERREIEADVLSAAIAQAEKRGFDQPLVWAAGDGWHPGVVGIVASRIKEAANRPAVVIGFDGTDGKGSGRSVTGVDLGASIATLARDGLIERGGGHKMAAGVSLTRTQLEPAMQRLSVLLERQGAHLRGAKDLTLSGLITTAAANHDLVEAIEKAGPFGASAPAPRIALAAAGIAFSKRAGERHLQLSLTDDGGAKLPAILFGAFDSDLGPRIENHNGAPFHFAGRLEIDEWGGRRTVKLRVEDVAEPI